MLRDVHAHISVQETSIRSTTPFVIRQQDPSIQHRSHATRTVCMKSARLCYPLQPRRTRGCCKNTLSKRGQMKGKDMGCRIWHQSRSCSTSVFLRLFGVSACAVLLLNSAGLGDVNQVCAHTGGLTKGLFPDQPVKLLELNPGTWSGRAAGRRPRFPAGAHTWMWITPTLVHRRVGETFWTANPKG